VIISNDTEYYIDGYEYSEGLLLVSIDDEEMIMSHKYSYVDKTGKLIAPYSDSIYYTVFQDTGLNLNFSEGLAPYHKDGKYIFIDKNGNQAIPQSYDFVEGFSDGLSAFYLDGRKGYIDKTGKEVIVFEKGEKVSDFGRFSEGLAPVIKDGKVGYINKKGETVIPHIYEPLDDGHTYWIFCNFSEGFAVIREGDWGVYAYKIIDKSGREVVPPGYDEIRSVKEGMSAFKVGNKWGFLKINP
jgi:hypothetical protein